MILLIDDAKDGGWADIVARNADAGLQILLSRSMAITELHIDFDLGSSSPDQDGLYVLRQALKNGLLPDIIWIVSLSPPGRKVMSEFLLDNGFKQTGNKFERE